ncbi:hypothetical protein UFOVP740_11 [uncultured Caudovirales phage]|uniref:Uncharacterized protein n=1 Tax=uncultured Caudovirales phage TaxID=2100421 RepID=A0A6J7X558_9CAUD|nr:hypothetical protein UFOVP740_11 [uncultured Caudovirales phage]
MGANAQTSVPTFTTGQVYTAQQANWMNTGIPVFATTTTRDAAFGGSGEKTLAQGQYAYIEATSTLQVYTGSAWVTAISTGLTYLTGGSFTTVAAVSLTAGTFSSTYRNYLININITANSSDSNALNWRGRASGTDNSTANYSFALGGRRYSDGLATAGGNGASATAGRLTFMQSPMTGSVVSATFFAPQLASPTSFVTSSTGRGVGDPDAALQGGGYFNASTQFDALSFYPATGTISGTYEVYGYAIS